MSSRGAIVATLIAVMAFLSACEALDTGKLSGSNLAPSGTPEVDEVVDGLVVGHRLMAAGEYELALKSYIREINNQGLSADVLSAIGSANLKLGRLKQARRYLEQSTEQDPDFVPAWNNLGVAQTSLKDFVGAHQSFRAAFALDNGASEEVWQNLLLAINNLKNNEAADADQTNFDLVRRGNGRYLLLETP